MSMRSEDTVVLHPGVQHSAELASAVYSQGRLLGLYTGLQVGQNPRFPWNLKVVRKRLSRRIHPTLPDACIQRIRPWATGAVRGMGRASRLQRVLETYLDEDAFARSVVKRLPAATRVAIGTDFSSGPIFRHLEAERPDVVRILDVSHPNDVARTQLLNRDSERWGLRAETYDDYTGAPPVSQHDEYALADLVVVASRFSASLLPDAVDRSRVQVVPYGVEVPPVPIPRMGGGGGRVLFVGALSERKGLSFLWRAAEELASEGVTVDVVGAAAPQYRPPNPLPASAKWRRGVSSASIRGLMDEADLLVLPSMCEGFGRVLLEALARGLPILTTNTSGGPDIAERVPDAPVTVIAVDDRPDLASHIRRALAQVSLDSSMWRQRFAGEFSEQAYRERWADVLTKAAEIRRL